MENIQFFYSTQLIILLTVIFMSFTKREAATINLYILQSLTITILMGFFYLQNPQMLFLIVLIATLAVKVIAGPFLFYRTIHKDRIRFATSSYLNLPLTMITIVALIALAHSRLLQPITLIATNNSEAIQLAIGVMFISLLLIVKQRGALAQVIGILSLENGIVSFILLAGLEQSAGLQLGILFDILVWITISAIFVSMIYKQFGTLDVTQMRHLKDD